jgi:hypothetical protein
MNIEPKTDGTKPQPSLIIFVKVSITRVIFEKLSEKIGPDSVWPPVELNLCRVLREKGLASEIFPLSKLGLKPAPDHICITESTSLWGLFGVSSLQDGIVAVREELGYLGLLPSSEIAWMDSVQGIPYYVHPAGRIGVLADDLKPAIASIFQKLMAFPEFKQKYLAALEQEKKEDGQE